MPGEQSGTEQSAAGGEGEWDEEQSKAAHRVSASQRWRVAVKDSTQLLLLILLFFQTVAQVKATEANSARQEEGRRAEEGSQHQEETIQQPTPDLGRRVETGCREWDAGRSGEHPRHDNSQEKDPRPLEKDRLGEDPSSSFSCR